MHLVHDRATNTLRLRLDRDTGTAGAPPEQVSGIIDIAEGGRLVGLELTPPEGIIATDWMSQWLDDPIAGEWVTIEDDGRVYIQLTTGDDRHVRSTPLTLLADHESGSRLRAISIPRRGAGYEISYPSGNQ